MSDGVPDRGHPEGPQPSRPDIPSPPAAPPPVDVPPLVAQLGNRDQAAAGTLKKGRLDTLREVAQGAKGRVVDAARTAQERAAQAAEAARAGAGRVAEVGGAAVGRVAEVATSERGRQVIEAAADLGLSAAERKFETARERAARKHGEKIAKAKKGFLGRLGWIGVLKTAGLAVADLHSTVTMYGVGDALVAADAARNLYQSTDKNRSDSERDALRKRALGKFAAAAVPFVPGSLTAPLIDAAIGDGEK